MSTSSERLHDSNAAVDDAVLVLHDRLDVLLDRLTDTVLGTPSPGSARWRNEFHTSGAITRAVRSGNRVTVRAMIAARAGVIDPAAPQQRIAPRIPDAVRAPRGRRRVWVDPAQLPMF